jgi:hypothetical protein
MSKTLTFAPPPVRLAVKIDLAREVADALSAAVEAHNAAFPEAQMKVDEAVAELVNRTVRSATKAPARGRKA